MLYAGIKLNFWNFFYIGASAIKSLEKSRIFRYGLPEDFFSEGQKTTGGGVQKRLIFLHTMYVFSNHVYMSPDHGTYIKK